MSSGPVLTEGARPPRNETAPLGIKVLCVGAGLLSVGTIYLGLVGVIAGLTANPSSTLVGPAEIAIVAGSLNLVLSVGQLIVLLGLWTRKPWAWTWALGLYGLMGLLRYGQGDVFVVTALLAVMVYIASKKEHYR
ncbi:hypothetical protein [Natrinema marinum]|uniref:hypothetical protein n=1 Tax=Natrinema marinum TaxID=2961598 RepID=UPI0020C89D3C|nr:hypothetical protein [Natrinema marinum]